MAGANALISRSLRQLTFGKYLEGPARLFSSKDTDKVDESPRLREFRKKLRERAPIEKLEELEEGKHPYQEKEPLKPFPDNTNPATGEIGGPRGPEPTRYGDWERKGRVTDF
ncbi:succinate dehydrogenase assembly factor 4, mitochondrial-like [Odontomachus brunneus]|uniref:succinate dehydrogenase assembly factor 4, mitochondrial-like n=1 Tax=Odontomachus brunneus TaxID=486640 RepID=UPI0013F25E67|nr:succinate dehydrogenase assembly factor 4, mitochondrial-like [Odontomachus brunneus]